jgi:NADH oxidase (H2O2-forming)
MAKRIIVIGSGAAGMTAASEAKRTDPSADVTVFTDDEHIAYSPCAIPWVLEGKIDRNGIIMHDPAFYARERGITVITGTKVTAADHGRRTVTAGGRDHPYDVLVIACGGTVFVPPVPGTGLKNLFKVRTVNDAGAISEAIERTEKVVVIGAGIIGLETAYALRGRGKDVTVIEMMDQIMPRITDRDIASAVQRYLGDCGVRFVLSTPLGSIDGNDSVSAVTAGGKRYECGLVIFATGVRANLEIPRMLGLDIGELGAVTVSPMMRPYRNGKEVDGIYLAGDIVQCSSAVNGRPTMSQLGSTAVRQGIVAGRNAAGSAQTVGPTVSPWISVIGDMEVGGAGMSEGLAGWYGIKTVSGCSEGPTCARYYPGGKELRVKMTADVSTHAIIGVQMIGGGVNGRINWMASVISGGTTVEGFLNNGENAYCPPTSMVRDPVFDAAEDLSEKLKKQAL